MNFGCNRLKTLAAAALALLLVIGILPVQAQQPSGSKSRVVLQVSDGDAAKWNLALNNARNLQADLGAGNVDIEIVAYGPGLHMLRSDSSPVQDRIKRLKDTVFPGKIQFSACNNTKQGMEKAEGRAVSIVPEATIVPSGVVRLMELQEQGWSYVRP